MFDTLRLSIILRLTPGLVNRARAHSPRLRALLASPRGDIQILSAGKPVGYFAVDHGEMRFRPGQAPRGVYAQHWRSAADALAVMLSQDETEMLRATEAGTLRMSGSFLAALWLNEVLKIARTPRTQLQTTKRFAMAGQGT